MPNTLTHFVFAANANGEADVVVVTTDATADNDHGASAAAVAVSERGYAPQRCDGYFVVDEATLSRLLQRMHRDAPDTNIDWTTGRLNGEIASCGKPFVDITGMAHQPIVKFEAPRRENGWYARPFAAGVKRGDVYDFTGAHNYVNEPDARRCAIALARKAAGTGP